MRNADHCEFNLPMQAFFLEVLGVEEPRTLYVVHAVHVTGSTCYA